MILLRECEYSRTWRLRTHKLIKIITGIFSAGTVGCCCTGRDWQALTLPRSVPAGEAREPWPSKPGFQLGKSSLSRFHLGSEFNPRSGDMKRKMPTVRTQEVCSDRLFPWALPKLERAGAAQGGNLREDFCGCCWTFPSESRSAREVLGQSAQEEQLQLPHTAVKSKAAAWAGFSCFPSFSSVPLAALWWRSQRGKVGVPSHILACAEEQRKLLEKGDT